MTLTDKKRKQLERFSSSEKLQQRLFRKKKHLNANLNNKKIGKFLIGERKRYLKLHEGEDLQRTNIDNILDAYQNAVKRGKIKSEGYVLAPNPYIFAKGNLGLMKDYTGHWENMRPDVVAYHAKIGEDETNNSPVHKEVLEEFKKLGLDKEVVAKTWTNFRQDLKTLEKENPHLLTGGEMNFKFLGFDKNKKMIIGLIDQIEDEVFLYSHKKDSNYYERCKKELEGINVARGKSLEQKVTSVIAVAGFLGSLVFLQSNVTGNAIADLSINTTSLVGGVLLAVGLVAGFFWIKSKKKNPFVKKKSKK